MCYRSRDNDRWQAPKDGYTIDDSMDLCMGGRAKYCGLRHAQRACLRGHRARPSFAGHLSI